MIRILICLLLLAEWYDYRWTLEERKTWLTHYWPAYCLACKNHREEK